MRKISKVSFVFILLVTVAIITTTVLANVNATETRYTSSLYMAPNTILTGESYKYNQSNYKISLFPKDFYSHRYCSLYIDLYKDDGIWGKTFLQGDLERMDALNTTYEYNRGNHGPCTAFYYFKLAAGGIQADPVYLYSYNK